MHDYIRGEYVHGDSVTMGDEYLDERWWYIEEAPGYMISDCGRIWSERSQWFIKPKPMDRAGHLGVCLRVDGKPRYFYLHRLMANAFIPNPDNFPVVRHLNDIKTDNELCNLAWGTQRDNMRDCIANGNAHFLTPEDREIGLQNMRTPLVAINSHTGERFVFKGQGEAARVLGIQQANIWKVLHGERPMAGGYYFKFLRKEEHDE